MSVNSNKSYVSIGDASLIGTRSTRSVIITNGVMSNNQGTIILGNFIPFYFGVRMPMLYVVQIGGNFVKQATPPQDIIYLTCLLSDILKAGYLYYFSDGHATDNLTSFYDDTQINNLLNIIDYTAIMATYWSGSSNLDLKRKKQAEFLIGQDVSPNYLFNFNCYDRNAKVQLINMGISDPNIIIMPQAYY